MEESYEIKYHKLEYTHWWFKGRRDIIFELIHNLDRNSRILEIGCSGGPLIKFLMEKGFKNIYGIDVSKRAIDFCKKKGIKNVFVMDGKKTKFKNNSFDLIISSDSLEHIKEDNIALSEWNRILKPNGKLIVFVPAFNFLWSKHDEVNKHYRRYFKKELINVIKRSRFRIIRSSYWNFILFFPTFFIRIYQRIFIQNKGNKEDQLFRINPILNNFLVYLLKFENFILQKINFPFGVSVFVIAKKL